MSEEVESRALLEFVDELLARNRLIAYKRRRYILIETVQVFALRFFARLS